MHREDVDAMPLTAPAEGLAGSQGGEAHEAVQRIVAITLASGLLVYFRKSRREWASEVGAAAHPRPAIRPRPIVGEGEEPGL